MPDQRTLFAAICAHPEGDAPRLAYADWLDENAGTMPAEKRESVRMHADLIRVQCALARLPPDDEDAETAARRIELEFRQEPLLKDYNRRRAWAKPLSPRSRTDFAPLPDANEFVRGFPLFARGDPRDQIVVDGALFNTSPLHVVESNILTPQSFLASRSLRRVRRFVTRLSDSADTTEQLFAAPSFANLEELELIGWDFRAPGSPVAGRPLAKLRRLFCRNNRDTLDHASFARLGELLPPETRIREFGLKFACYTADDLAAIVDLPQFCALERLLLDVRWNGGYPASPLIAGVRAIIRSPCWQTLRTFRDDMQSYCGFRAPDAKELAAAPAAPNLRTLALTSGRLEEGFRAIAESPLLASVTTLDLSNTPFGDAGAILLAKSPHLQRLLYLNVTDCAIGPAGIKAITEAPWAENLVRLNMSGCPIRKGGIDALVAPGNFPNLKRLDAGGAAKIAEQKNRLISRFGDRVRF